MNIFNTTYISVFNIKEHYVSAEQALNPVMMNRWD